MFQELFFVIKWIKIGADFFYSIKTLNERLQANAFPIQLPIGTENNFIGIINLLTMKAEIYKDELGKKKYYYRYSK